MANRSQRVTRTSTLEPFRCRQPLRVAHMPLGIRGTRSRPSHGMHATMPREACAISVLRPHGYRRAAPALACGTSQLRQATSSGAGRWTDGSARTADIPTIATSISAATASSHALSKAPLKPPPSLLAAAACSSLHQSPPPIGLVDPDPAATSRRPANLAGADSAAVAAWCTRPNRLTVCRPAIAALRARTPPPPIPRAPPSPPPPGCLTTKKLLQVPSAALSVIHLKGNRAWSPTIAWLRAISDCWTVSQHPNGVGL